MNTAEWMQSSLAIVRVAVAHMRRGTPSIAGAGSLLCVRWPDGATSAAESRGIDSQRGARLVDWMQIQNSWYKYVAAAKSQWIKLSEEQLRATRGRYDVLSARVQEAYGLTSREADVQISAWQSRQSAR
jgi:hypothetical protein